MITYIEINKEKLYETLISPGQIIYVTDTGRTFFDTEEGTRIGIKNVIYINNELEREQITDPIENSIYIVRETYQTYRFKESWFKIKDCDSLLCTVFHNDKYIPTTLTKKGKKIAPRTLASAVYNDRGEGISVEIESSNRLTLCKTKAVYVQATQNNQRSFKIPFPISNYDLTKNYMTVIINNKVIDISKYTIRDDDYLVLDNNQPGLNFGQLVLFVFYYNIYIDINSGLIIHNKNLANRCVTEDKLDTNSVSTRTIIDRAVNNPKLADDAVDARVLAPASIRTEHLDSSNFKISVDNITETENKKFISQTQINNWNDNMATVERLKITPELHVSDTEPQNVKEKDIWADTTNFIFKVRKDNSWLPMGAVYK